MFKFVLLVILFITVREVQLQRSPYAGSTNRFRGQPVNIVPAMSSTPTSTVTLPSTVDSTTTISTIRTITAATPQPENSSIKPEISLPERISSEVELQLRDQAVHIVPAMPSPTSTLILPSTAAEAIKSSTKSTKPGKVLPGRISGEFISDRNENQYRDYRHHRRDKYQGDFDYYIH